MQSSTVSGVIKFLFVTFVLVLKAFSTNSTFTVLQHNITNISLNSSPPNSEEDINSTSSYRREISTSFNLNTTMQTSPSSTNLFCKEKPLFRLGRGPLLTYLLRLKFCQELYHRPWFDEACEDRTYSFSKYQELVYDKFCNPKAYESLCKQHTKIRHLAIKPSLFNANNISADIFSYHNMSSSGDDMSKEGSDVSKDHAYCTAIESYFDTLLEGGFSTNETSPPGSNLPFYNVQYTEWFLTFRDFCDPTSCGVSLKNYKNFSLTAYNCYSSSCDVVLIVDMVIDGILALFIVTANSLVLLVAFRSAAMKNIPGYFKISLACADLLIGLVVLPCVINNHYVMLFKPLPYRNEGQTPKITDYFSQIYVNFTGIVTMVSIFTSVYTLGMASVDRYLAVTRPFLYEKGKYFTKRKAIFVLASIWILGFICSTLPLFLNADSYTLTAVDLTFSTGLFAIFLYSLLLGLPLIAVWAINIALLVNLCSKTNRIDSKRSTLKSIFSFKKNKPRSKSLSTQNSKTNSKEQTMSEKEKRNRRNLIRTKEKNMDLEIGSKPNITRNQNSFLKMKSINENRRLALTLGIMVGTYTLALLPCILLLALQRVLNIDPLGDPKHFSKKAMFDYTSVEYVCVRLFLSNSFWNCIIYSVRSVVFRSAVVDVFTCNEDKRRQKRASATFSS